MNITRLRRFSSYFCYLIKNQMYNVNLPTCGGFAHAVNYLGPF